MIRRRRQTPVGSLEALAIETSELVGRLLRDNRVLRAENQALKREVERLSSGWEEIKKLARDAPRKRPTSRTPARPRRSG
jgi:predicted RNase H-like nuclease (RuvC/YqgF family)